MGLTLFVVGWLIIAAGVVFAAYCVYSGFRDKDADGGFEGATIVLLITLVLVVVCSGALSTVTPSKWSTQTDVVASVMRTGDPNAVRVYFEDSSLKGGACHESICATLQKGDEVSFEYGVEGYAFVRGSAHVRNVGVIAGQ